MKLLTVVLLLVVCTNSFSGSLEKTLRQCKKELEEAAAAGTISEREIVLISELHPQIMLLNLTLSNRRDVNLDQKGKGLLGELLRWGERSAERQKAISLHDRNNIIGRLQGIAQRLYPNNSETFPDLKALRGVLAYGIEALKREHLRGFGAKILETDLNLDESSEQRGHSLKTYSIAGDDLDFLSGFGELILKDKRAGVRLVRAIVHAMADTLHIPQNAPEIY